MDGNDASQYNKTSYSGIISIRDLETGEMREVATNRTVYQNTDIDPYLVIPAGTKIGKEVIQQDVTNLERMSAGKSPIVSIENVDGSVSYERIELHHLSGLELQPGTLFFNGELQDGTVVEIRSSVHDAKQLHSLQEKSFRKVKIETTDEYGRVLRMMSKSFDAYHYDRFRVHYWKERAAKIAEELKSDNAKEGKNMGLLNKTTNNPQENKTQTVQSSANQEKSFRESLKYNVDPSLITISDVNSKGSAFPDPMEKGDELDQPNHVVQEDENLNTEIEELDMEDDELDLDDDGLEL